MDTLSRVLDGQTLELLLPHVNLYAYGQALIQRENAARTSYGLLQRADGQPMLTLMQGEREEMEGLTM